MRGGLTINVGRETPFPVAGFRATAFVRLTPLTDVGVEKIGVLSDRPRPFSRGDSDRRFSQSAGRASVPDSPLPFDGGTSLRHFRVRTRGEVIVSPSVRR